jgi:BMFP domain-containing protein YqiC
MDAFESVVGDPAAELLRGLADGPWCEKPWSELEVRRAVDHVLDQLVRLTSERDLQRSLLAGCAENVAQGRTRIAALEAELSDTLAVAVSARERNECLTQDIDELRSRVEALAPYEVSAKYQLRALRSSIPLAIRKRIHGRREHGDGAGPS